VGLAAGGLLTDALGKHDAKWYALIPAAGLLLALPLYVLSFLQSNWRLSAVFLSVAGFFQYVSFGPTFGVFQNVVDARRRATATAIVYVLLTLVGLGAGPPFTGWLIDHFASANFQHPGIHSVPDAFAALLLQHASGVATFQASCPLGAIGSVATSLQGACSEALALASRQGIIVTVLLYGWAAAHYLLAARGLSRLMPRKFGMPQTELTLKVSARR
jgi:hypothetical protein